jgi:hypothetical protein
MNQIDAWARHAHAANGFGDAAVSLAPARNRSHGTEAASGLGDAALTERPFDTRCGRLDMNAGVSVMGADSPRRHYPSPGQPFLSLPWPPHCPTPLY